MSLSSITPMPRIISLTISIVGYKYERRFQRLIDDLINYQFFKNQNPFDTFCTDLPRIVLEVDFMAINANLIRRPSDRSLFLAAAIGFPLVVLIGYFKS